MQIAVVLQALQSDPFKDYRTELNQQPLFKKGIKRIIDLKVGSTVTGRISLYKHNIVFVLLHSYSYCKIILLLCSYLL